MKNIKMNELSTNKWNDIIHALSFGINILGIGIVILLISYFRSSKDGISIGFDIISIGVSILFLCIILYLLEKTIRHKGYDKNGQIKKL